MALLGPALTAADDDAARQLQQLRGRIQTLQQQLDRTLGERDSEVRELRRVEGRIGVLHREIKRIDGSLRDGQQQLERLQRQERAARAELAEHGRRLQGQIRAAYASGRQEYLKLVLNQHDPAAVSRMLVYYRYLHAARVARIHETEAGLERLEQLEGRIAASRRELQALRERRLRESDALAQARDRRSTVLAGLEGRVRSQSQEIDQLHQNERELQSLVNNLQTVLLEAPQARRLETRFQDLKGRLPLPVDGRIAARFGARKHLGDLRWKGLFLAAPEGRDVSAVFRGRVAYADWLRGFGLLLILEHGDGYMTLYGHNRSLYKEVGEWVETGEIIASTGSTGNPPQPGVYFEIRHNGAPNDPLAWCEPRFARR